MNGSWMLSQYLALFTMYQSVMCCSTISKNIQSNAFSGSSVVLPVKQIWRCLSLLLPGSEWSKLQEWWGQRAAAEEEGDTAKSQTVKNKCIYGVKCHLSWKARPLYGSRATSDQWAGRIQKYRCNSLRNLINFDCRKSLLYQVASVRDKQERSNCYNTMNNL